MLKDVKECEILTDSLPHASPLLCHLHKPGILPLQNNRSCGRTSGRGACNRRVWRPVGPFRQWDEESVAPGPLWAYGAFWRTAGSNREHRPRRSPEPMCKEEVWVGSRAAWWMGPYGSVTMSLWDESQNATTDLINRAITAAYTPTETMTSNIAMGFSWRQS